MVVCTTLHAQDIMWSRYFWSSRQSLYQMHICPTKISTSYHKSCLSFPRENTLKCFPLAVLFLVWGGPVSARSVLSPSPCPPHQLPLQQTVAISTSPLSQLPGTHLPSPPGKTDSRLVPRGQRERELTATAARDQLLIWRGRIWVVTIGRFKKSSQPTSPWWKYMLWNLSPPESQPASCHNTLL